MSEKGAGFKMPSPPILNAPALLRRKAAGGLSGNGRGRGDGPADAKSGSWDFIPKGGEALRSSVGWGVTSGGRGAQALGSLPGEIGSPSDCGD